MTKRTRDRQSNPGEVPKQWPNGSGFYKEGTAHLKEDRSLLGRTIRGQSGAYKAWRYMGYGDYKYLGIFRDHLAALQAIKKRA